MPTDRPTPVTPEERVALMQGRFCKGHNRPHRFSVECDDCILDEIRAAEVQRDREWEAALEAKRLLHLGDAPDPVTAAQKLADNYDAHTIAELRELREWAENLRHSDDARINWDHPGNDRREQFYKNNIAHAWIQAGQAMVRWIDRRIAQLAPNSTTNNP